MPISSRILFISAALSLTVAACDEKEKGSPGDSSELVGETPDGPTTGAEAGEEEGEEATEPAATEPAATEPAATEPGATEEGEATTADEEPSGPPMEEWPEPAAPCPDRTWEESQRECVLEGGEEGWETCVFVDGAEVWTPCTGEYHCLPGDGYDQGCLGAYCVWDGEKFYEYAWQTDPNCDTPLVLRFDAAPLTFSASPAGAGFDFRGANAAGTCHTDWPDAPWLALDRDRSGSIDGGHELFGSGTRLASGGRAAHGFAALAELDSDGDGSITASDALFSSLVLWSDDDADRVGALSELRPIGEAGLVAIHLAYTRLADCDERGNCGGERASFEFRAADGSPRTGEVVDVYLACQ